MDLCEDIWRYVFYLQGAENQAALASVCKDWHNICDSVPSMTLSFEANVNSKIQRVVEPVVTRALLQKLCNCTRLEELKLKFKGVSIGTSLDVVKEHVSSSLKVLTVHEQGCDGPKLEEVLGVWGFDLAAFIAGFPLLRVLKLNWRIPLNWSKEQVHGLKVLKLHGANYSGRALESIVKCCTSLEELEVYKFTDKPKLESSSLVTVTLVSYSPEDHHVVINACKLAHLNYFGGGSLVLGKATNQIETMRLACRSVTSLVQGPLDKLSKLEAVCMDTSDLLNLVSTAKNLKELTSEFCMDEKKWRLEQLVPPELETLYITINDLETLIVDDYKEQESEDRKVQDPSTGKFKLQLKSIHILGRSFWRMKEDKLLFLLELLLRSLPHLENLRLHEIKESELLSKLQQHDDRVKFLSRAATDSIAPPITPPTME